MPPVNKVLGCLIASFFFAIGVGNVLAAFEMVGNIREPSYTQTAIFAFIIVYLALDGMFARRR